MKGLEPSQGLVSVNSKSQIQNRELVSRGVGNQKKSRMVEMHFNHPAFLSHLIQREASALS